MIELNSQQQQQDATVAAPKAHNGGRIGLSSAQFCREEKRGSGAMKDALSLPTGRTRELLLLLMCSLKKTTIAQLTSHKWLSGCCCQRLYLCVSDHTIWLVEHRDALAAVRTALLLQCTATFNIHKLREARYGNRQGGEALLLLCKCLKSAQNLYLDT
jgi:hypothetical protein